MFAITNTSGIYSYPHDFRMPIQSTVSAVESVTAITHCMYGMISLKVYSVCCMSFTGDGCRQRRRCYSYRAVA